MPKGVDFIKNFGNIAQCNEPVTEPRRNPGLLAIYFRKDETGPLAKIRRAPTKIHCDIEDLATQAGNEFGLRLPQLVVQAADDSAQRAREVVLNKGPLKTRRFSEYSGVELLGEKTSVIGKQCGF
jgi:hypothetical protein